MSGAKGNRYIFGYKQVEEANCEYPFDHLLNLLIYL